MGFLWFRRRRSDAQKLVSFPFRLVRISVNLSLSLSLAINSVQLKLENELCRPFLLVLGSCRVVAVRRWRFLEGGGEQCGQIWQCIELWATFQSLRQQLVCPNLPHSCKGVKIFHFSIEIIFGQLL